VRITCHIGCARRRCIVGRMGVRAYTDWRNTIPLSYDRVWVYGGSRSRRNRLRPARHLQIGVRSRAGLWQLAMRDRGEFVTRWRQWRAGQDLAAAARTGKAKASTRALHESRSAVLHREMAEDVIEPRCLG